MSNDDAYKRSRNRIIESIKKEEAREAKEPNKTVLLIHTCCGKGAIQAMNLVHALNAEGLTFELATGNHRSCKGILEQFGIDPASVRKNPQVYVDDIMFPAVSLNDKKFMEKMVDDLKKVNQ